MYVILLANQKKGKHSDMNILQHIKSFKTDLHASANQVAKKAGLSIEMIDAMYHIDGNNGCTTTEIAYGIKVKGPSLSRTLESLFDRGLIKTAQSPGDMRVFLHTLRPKGTRILLKHHDQLIEAMTPTKAEARIHCAAIMKLSK